MTTEVIVLQNGSRSAKVFWKMVDQESFEKVGEVPSSQEGNAWGIFYLPDNASLVITEEDTP